MKIIGWGIVIAATIIIIGDKMDEADRRRYIESLPRLYKERDAKITWCREAGGTSKIDKDNIKYLGCEGIK